ALELAVGGGLLDRRYPFGDVPVVGLQVVLLDQFDRFPGELDLLPLLRRFFAGDPDAFFLVLFGLFGEGRHRRDRRVVQRDRFGDDRLGALPRRRLFVPAAG